MEAQNLTISIPPKKEGPICDKNCPYCISVMTGYTTSTSYNFYRNIEKALTLARAANVSNVLLTGKGEPLLNFEVTCTTLSSFRDFPLEIQTNGLWLSRHLEKVEELKDHGLDTIAISIDSSDGLHKMKGLIETIHELNMTCRICLNLTDRMKDLNFRPIFEIVKLYKVDQLLIRNIMIPQKVNYNAQRAVDAVKWIKEHVDPIEYKKLYIGFETMIDRERDLVRVLPHGVEVFDLEGIAVSFSDYCVQENNNTKDIRSLIYDGHMYTSWDKMPASRLF